MHYNHTIYKHFREYANFENRVVKTMVAMVTSMFIVGIVCLWQPPRWLPTVIKDIKSPWTQITVETCSGKQQKMYCLQSNMLCIVWIQLLYSLRILTYWHATPTLGIPCKMKPKEYAQKFHTDVISLPSLYAQFGASEWQKTSFNQSEAMPSYEKEHIHT